ncbi:hypothetical protein M407DRAFT_31098 [Tulasnella calospora MUT 4182]|uniref:F-box domain-containing protein n=1 Tax=Tulasnella calospora MUT 4182 TaxID=1051891 RepID=A0A0C3Q665_9AGAM|nr:hypothetical protein M407DRAFT_31098 [Tulasnella calospora MUT 4182]
MPSPATRNSYDSVDKISQLPNELLVTFLKLALPEVDIMVRFLASGVCWSYVARLYALRQVSTSWRDLVDGTPNLWSIVSSATPIDITAVCLSRSKTCPLLIHYGSDEAPEASKEQESFLQFSQLTIPHRHRWAIVWLNAAPDLVSDQLRGAMPLLHTVILHSRGWKATPGLNPGASPETSLGIDITSLHHVELYGELGGDGLTTEHILGVLRENPLLEVLEMDRLKVQILPDTMLTPISLLRLRTIIFRWCKGDFVNHILRQIQTSVDLIDEFLIAIHHWGTVAPIGFLTDALASWSPVLKKAHRTCNGSTFSADDLRTFFWKARGAEKAFHCFLFGLGAVTGAQWMMDVFGQMDEPGPGIGIEFRSRILRNAEAIRTFGSMDRITTFEAQADWNEESLQTLFQTLGNPITPGFPCLKTLKLKDWRWGMETIVEMLQARFPENGTGPTKLPKLTIELSSATPWWLLGDPPTQRQIIDFRTVIRMSSLNGVEQVRFGSAGGNVGMLGVVWSDELLGPTWG